MLQQPTTMLKKLAQPFDGLVRLGRAFIQDDEAPSAVEYAVLLAVAIAVAAVIGTVVVAVRSRFEAAGNRGG